jgi:hypothetical protein
MFLFEIVCTYCNHKLAPHNLTFYYLGEKISEAAIEIESYIKSINIEWPITIHFIYTYATLDANINYDLFKIDSNN